jgi:hypothetical protein
MADWLTRQTSNIRIAGRVSGQIVISVSQKHYNYCLLSTGSFQGTVSTAFREADNFQHNRTKLN